MPKTIQLEKEYNLICVGGGIMSATLALMLKLIDANLNILILERLDKVALESSGAWNNAGTGHSALCELNYTPQKKDGSIDVTKALEVFKQFEQSKQFWSYLVKQGYLTEQAFIHAVPHHSWVSGKEDVDFLRKRVEKMKQYSQFEEMEFSEDFETLKKWFPLIMEGRENDKTPMAGTRMQTGTEVNFGLLTKNLFKILEEEFDTPVHTGFEVVDVDPAEGVDWLAEIKNLNTNEKFYCDATHVFIGAGGGALPLLQKVEIEEKNQYGGFPVSGQWLICKNRDVIKQHHAKVYSKAGPDAPPMSTPHLDTRNIKGKKELLFGPFAGFSTKFLKEGSYLDLFKSVNFENIPAMWGVFWHNLPLTKYLVGQVKMNHEDRMEELRDFIKDADSEDWELKVAGQRVQIIKKDEEQGGTLEFGTEVVHSKNGAITALLGASPGASVAVNIMVTLLHFAFPEKAKSKAWKEKLDEMIPFWNKDIQENEKEFKKLQYQCCEVLGIGEFSETMKKPTILPFSEEKKQL